MSFVLPACRSSFSLRYGTAAVESLLRALKERQHDTALLLDRNNLYGAYDFYYAAQETALKPLIGAEVSTSLGNLYLICENYEGFKNLSRLITHYHLRGEPSAEVVAQYSGNMVCLSRYNNCLSTLREIFADHFYVALGSEREAKAAREAGRQKFPLAALPLVSFLTKSDYPAHRLLRAIDGGYLLDNLPSSGVADEREYLRTPDEYRRGFQDFPEAVKNSAEIVRRCALQFPQRRNILPDLALSEDHYERLHRDALDGLRRRLPTLPGQYIARLEYELSVIRRTGFVDYFLIVGDIVRFCRETRIASVGRGSAAGSLVSFGLGITEVDPIREGLYFERFLNEARSDCPDIDIDIDWRYRDNVLDYIYKKYGEEHVAMMATYTRFQPRLAIRECSKALGIPAEEVDRFLKRLPRESLEELSHESEAPTTRINRFKVDWERFAPVLRAARRIAGLPRHLGIHSGGIVITPQPLSDYVPLERATKGIVVTQCDMYQAEKIGLVKIDILGQRGLAVIADCFAAVRKEEPSFHIPDNDRKTYEMLQAGKTIGVFQIESPGLRALLRDLHPVKLNDITLALALIRPGASESGMKKIFLNRFHGKERTEYLEPSLEPILRETFGVFVYQEQVILAAQAVAGFNLAASDLLRRSITKKRKQEEQHQLKERFLLGAMRKGVVRANAENIFAQLAQFASFGFCKAHAATYGYLAYQSAYFKRHYPAIFMTAVLRNGGGYYPAAVYVAEARRLGIPIAPPTLNISTATDSLHKGTLYLGVSRVKEVGETILKKIGSLNDIKSLEDFLAGAEISDDEMENLIKVGFFDAVESSRERLLWRFRLRGKKENKRIGGFFAESEVAMRLREFPVVPLSRYRRLRYEMEILGLPASFHPLQLFPAYQNPDLSELGREGNGAIVSLSGWLADRKRIRTRDGKDMVFLTFDALDDTFEIILFPAVYDRFRELVRNYRYLRIEGELQRDSGIPAIVGRALSPAPTGLPEAEFI